MMNKYLTKIMLLYALSNSLSVYSISPIEIVESYCSTLQRWCQTNDIEYRKSLNEICNYENVSCRVDDDIVDYFASINKSVKTESLSVLLDTYLNGFQKCINDGGVEIEYSDIMIDNSITFPEISSIPHAQCVTANITLKDRVTSKNLFVIREGKITAIYSINKNKPLTTALSLYSQKRYSEAFDLFRQLALRDPTAYDAQYCILIMELKNQGCHGLSPRYRDWEIYKWLYRFSYLGVRPKGTQFLYSTYVTKDGNYRPIDNFMRPSYDGMMVMEKSSKYGYMNEHGKIIIKYIYDDALPFCNEKLACVKYKGKWGYIDRDGNFAVSPIYTSIAATFVDGKTIATKDGQICLIDTEGNILRQITTRVKDIKCFPVIVKHEAGIKACCLYSIQESKLYYYNFDGEIIEVIADFKFQSKELDYAQLNSRKIGYDLSGKYMLLWD